MESPRKVNPSANVSPKPINAIKRKEDDDKLTALSLASFDYGGDRNVRSRPMIPSVVVVEGEQQQQQQQPPPPQQPIQHLSQQPIRPHPRRIQSIQTTTLPSQPSQPQSPLPLVHPVPTCSTPPPLPLPPPPSAAASSSPSHSSVRSSRNSSPESSAGIKGKNKIIPPPFPWATEHKAKAHKIDYLIQNKILTITGTVQCKRCDRKYEMGFDLTKKFAEVCMFVRKWKSGMHCRAPKEWSNPVLPTCRHCGEENSAKPIIEVEKKRSINWLFLWLGQLLGLCTLSQLKYFCKQTMNHRTADKDHLIYLVYIRIGQQLAPGNFDSL